MQTRHARAQDGDASSAGRCISAHSPNKRTLYNFPMQGNGAEMLRLAAWRLCEAGIVPSMLVHDGILLEVQNEEQIAHAIEIMKAAGRDVCDGFEIGVDVDQMLRAWRAATRTSGRWRRRCGRRSWTRWRRSAPFRRGRGGMTDPRGNRIETETVYDPLDDKRFKSKRRRLRSGKRFAMLTEEQLKLLAETTPPPPWLFTATF